MDEAYMDEVKEALGEALEARRDGLRGYQVDMMGKMEMAFEATKGKGKVIFITGVGASVALIREAVKQDEARQRARVEEIGKEIQGEIVVSYEAHYSCLLEQTLHPGKLTALELEQVMKRENPTRIVHEDADARPRKAWQTCHGPAQRTRKGRA